MNNWKTTAAAITYAVGKFLQTYQHGPSWMFLVGQVLEYAAIGGGFIVAKDSHTQPKP
jgi:hypothetical protein